MLCCSPQGFKTEHYPAQTLALCLSKYFWFILQMKVRVCKASNENLQGLMCPVNSNTSQSESNTCIQPKSPLMNMHLISFKSKSQPAPGVSVKSDYPCRQRHRWLSWPSRPPQIMYLRASRQSFLVLYIAFSITSKHTFLGMMILYYNFDDAEHNPKCAAAAQSHCAIFGSFASQGFAKT